MPKANPRLSLLLSNDCPRRHTIEGAYAIYPHSIVDGINSAAEMVEAYGKLYNWYAVDDDRGLCPEGWHVPTDAEWTTLTDYLGGSSIAGGKMKSTRTEPDPHPRWASPNTEPLDTTVSGGVLRNTLLITPFTATCITMSAMCPGK